ncbi:iron ABC transporter substrate-binding protein [Pelagibacterium lentulum]|uniref:Iron ABC transporter substrate-binding protein n=1 Tax=Pelagibacterium lentulum TaxID=2029865 RepID=A0A916W0K2_9HYPH|nr:iron ABC transporter substrate-binding protein [Pelagibacterium lentulum]GGA56611.1 iron ABC transporter substrate-binding protein [Pelagibacterium lentulum]
MNKILLASVATLSLMAPITAVSAQELTVYSGRGEALVGSIITQFERDTGVTVNVRYGGTSELATLLLEEGDQTPADLFWAQDGGALGALAPVFAELPAEINEGVAAPFRNPANKWAPTSGRSRVLVYSTERVSDDEFPASVFDLTDEQYRGRVAWAPTNGSFQAFVTAFRVVEGDEAAKAWLEGMIANDAQVYPNNNSQIVAVADGEVDFGLINNYYLANHLRNNANLPVSQTHFEAGDIGNMLNVAGAGVVAASDNQELALQFIEYLLSVPAQQYITTQGNEYPVIPGVIENPTLEPYAKLLEISPAVDIDEISDLEGTLALLREVGLI